MQTTWYHFMCFCNKWTHSMFQKVTNYRLWTHIEMRNKVEAFPILDPSHAANMFTSPAAGRVLGSRCWQWIKGWRLEESGCRVCPTSSGVHTSQRKKWSSLLLLLDVQELVLLSEPWIRSMIRNFEASCILCCWAAGTVYEHSSVSSKHIQTMTVLHPQQSFDHIWREAVSDPRKVLCLCDPAGARTGRPSALGAKS